MAQTIYQSTILDCLSQEMKALRPFKTSVSTYQSAGSNNGEELNVYQPPVRHSNLLSAITHRCLTTPVAGEKRLAKYFFFLSFPFPAFSYIRRHFKYTNQIHTILYIYIYNILVFNTYLLLILQSSDWLSAFHLELLQAIIFIAV